jgi:hypothetical protein
MAWIAIFGMVLIFVSVAILTFGSDRKLNTDGLKEWMRACCVIAIFIGMFLWGVYIMINTYKDALDRNPYEKEYVYKQSPDGSMVKYDSLYVRKK